MDHEEKVAQMLEDLGSRGIWRSTAAPPIFWMLWSIGWKVKPPFFLRFWELALGAGAGFTVAWGILMLLMGHFSSLETAVLPSMFAGAFFGLFSGGYYRIRAKMLGLPSWDQYAPRGAKSLTPHKHIGDA